ncbi:unnamed protein product [Pedinophyceae sp. YPF-701]|nr:unnamed protein product [Pedinophyceae sp. YPF-701]
MKLKELEMMLQDVQPFAHPKIELEQYPTGADIAARMLYAIDTAYGDIQEKVVVDLGCGPGMLSIGCAILEADQVIGIDVDVDALATCRANCEDFEGIDAALELLQCDVAALGGLEGRPTRQRRLRADTVVTNPPFGTRRKGADIEFVRAAFAIEGVRAVYSLHKTSTRDHVGKAARGLGAVEAEVIAELRYDLPASYGFHKQKSRDVEVDVWRFVPGAGRGGVGLEGLSISDDR